MKALAIIAACLVPLAAYVAWLRWPRSRKIDPEQTANYAMGPNGVAVVSDGDHFLPGGTNLIVFSGEDCSECGGCGWITVAECCGHPYRGGECCGDPVPAQGRCPTCDEMEQT